MSIRLHIFSSFLVLLFTNVSVSDCSLAYKLHQCWATMTYWKGLLINRLKYTIQLIQCVTNRVDQNR